MHGAFRVRRQHHHRQHGVLAGENARGEARREIAKQAVMRVIQIVKFGFFDSLVLPSTPFGPMSSAHRS